MVIEEWRGRELDEGKSRDLAVVAVPPVLPVAGQAEHSVREDVRSGGDCAAFQR